MWVNIGTNVTPIVINSTNLNFCVPMTVLYKDPLNVGNQFFQVYNVGRIGEWRHLTSLIWRGELTCMGFGRISFLFPSLLTAKKHLFMRQSAVNYISESRYIFITFLIMYFFSNRMLHVRDTGLYKDIPFL